MNGAPFDALMLALFCLALISATGVLSELRPFQIVGQGARQCLQLLREGNRLPLYAFVFLTFQELAPSFIAAHGVQLWTAIGIVILVKSLSVYALAHVAYRLHRGLIYKEWVKGLSWGRQERRMALYVLLGWSLVTLAGNFPMPAAFHRGPTSDLLAGVMISISVFILKTFLALIGPAASLGDPKPLRRSISSVVREPAGIFSLVALIRLMLELLRQAFGLATGALAGFEIGQWLIMLASQGAMMFLFVLSEFAVVIALTRTWEDHYEDETRHAAHNLDWL